MAVTATLDITPQQRELLIVLIERVLPGVTIWAYGSRVKGTARPASDLDLVAFVSREQRSQARELKEQFDECNLPFLVDLHVWEELPPNFQDEIARDHVVLCG